MAFAIQDEVQASRDIHPQARANALSECVARARLLLLATGGRNTPLGERIGGYPVTTREFCLRPATPR